MFQSVVSALCHQTALYAHFISSGTLFQFPVFSILYLTTESLYLYILTLFSLPFSCFDLLLMT